MRCASTKTLTAMLLVWLLAVIAAVAISNDFMFMFAYYVLPYSAFLVPVVVGAIAVRMWPAEEAGGHSRQHNHALSIAAAAIALAAYVLAAAVLARTLEIPWRLAKFGDDTFSLGVTAALQYSVVALTILAAAVFLLGRVPSPSRPWQAAVASIGMLTFSSALYFIVGVSPLSQWRE